MYCNGGEMLLLVKTYRMYNINSKVNYGLEGVETVTNVSLWGYISDPVCDTSCLAVHTVCTAC